MVENALKLYLNVDSLWKKHSTSQITEDYANIIFGEYAETHNPEVLDEIGLLHISWLMENKYFTEDLPDGPVDKMLLDMGKKLHTKKKVLRKKYQTTISQKKIQEEFQDFHKTVLGKVPNMTDVIINNNGIYDFSYFMYDIFRKMKQKIPEKYHTKKTKFAPIISLILSNLVLEYKGEL